MTLAGELQGVLDEHVAATGVTGAATAVLVGDELHVATAGVTSSEHPNPISADTLFQVASITKTFTSAAVMLLVEEGALALEDPLAAHLPDLVAAGVDLDDITIERALSHQAGFDGDHLFVFRTDDLTSLREARRLFAPGTGVSYSNAGFSLAGEVVARTSGQPFPRFVRDRLLKPLGMRSASFTADEAITNPVALPHFVFEGTSHLLRNAGWQRGWQLTPNDLAAGGLAASATQIAAWGRFQLTGCTPDGARLLADESLARLHTPVVRIDAVEEIALDWFVRRPGPGEHVTWSHGGVTAGYCSDLTVAPGAGVAVATLTNATNGAWVHDAVRQWVLAEAAGIDERDPEPDPAVTVDVDRLTGRYLSSFCQLDLAPGTEAGTFVATPIERDDVEDAWLPPIDSPVTFGFFGPHDAVSLNAAGPKRIAHVDPHGERAQWLTWGGRRAVRRDP